MAIHRREFLAALPPLWIAATKARADDPPAGGNGNGDEAIATALRGIREGSGLPGLTGAIARLGKPTRVGAVGERKNGSPEAFLATDLVHLGSDTKAMTATMIATLVEEGKLSWASTLGEVFPGVAMHAEARPITLDQLLTHRAGMPANVDWHSLGAKRSTTEQRRELLRRVTKTAPESPPGTKFLYSNVGYALAGLMAETVARLPWEALMRDRLFKPLNMKSAGFGPPGTKARVDQPWGHGRVLGKLVPSQLDNAAALGPAGTTHCTMADWAKFAELHLKGARGEPTPILKPETFRALQTPPPGGDYAKGWIVTARDWADGTVLTHAGSNTQWLCVAWLAPNKGVAYLAATNEGGEAAQNATDAAVAAMIGFQGD